MSRDRSSGGHSWLESWRTYYDQNGVLTSTVPFQDREKYVAGERKRMIDYPTSGYHTRRERGDVVMSPYTLWIDTYKSSEDDCMWKASDNTYSRYVGPVAAQVCKYPSYPSWLATRTSDEKNQQLIEAYASIAESEANSLVTVMEAVDTANMMRAPFAQAGGLLHKIAFSKAKYVSKGLSYAKAATAAWLEYRLGWKPLLYDIQSIQNAYAVSTKERIDPVRLVERSSTKISWSAEFVDAPYSQPYQEGIRAKGNFVTDVKVSAGVIYDLQDDTLAATEQRAFGLNLSNVPAAMWELVPYSFVVDRFVSVGKWLNAIVPKPGVTILGNWTSVTRNDHSWQKMLEWRAYGNQAVNYPPTNATVSSEYAWKHAYIERRVNQPITWTLPINRGALSLSQTMDHYALIMSALVGLKVPKR